MIKGNNMDSKSQLDNLAKTISEFMPASLQDLQSDFEKNIRTALESGLRKMNLVTREEFDIQNAVLLRTREKLEALEKRVEKLENIK